MHGSSFDNPASALISRARTIRTASLPLICGSRHCPRWNSRTPPRFFEVAGACGKVEESNETIEQQKLKVDS